jgi:hypothetical protein
VVAGVPLHPPWWLSGRSRPPAHVGHRGRPHPDRLRGRAPVADVCGPVRAPADIHATDGLGFIGHPSDASTDDVSPAHPSTIRQPAPDVASDGDAKPDATTHRAPDTTTDDAPHRTTDAATEPTRDARITYRRGDRLDVRHGRPCG